VIGGLARWLRDRRPEKLKYEAERADSEGLLGRGSKAGASLPPHQLGDLGECCKLAHWGPGRSCGKVWFWCISGLEISSNLDSSQLVGRSQLLELYKKFISESLGSQENH